MKSYIVRKKSKSMTKSLKRETSLQSQQTLKASSIGERSQLSGRRSLQRHKQYSKSVAKGFVPPYQNFAKELKIRLPTPKQKFYEFLKIQPFNRLQNHNELIALFLKNVKFFKNHQSSLVINFSRKIRLVDQDQLQEKIMVIVLEGECMYQNRLYHAGQLLNRKYFIPTSIRCDSNTKLLGISRHEYLSFLSSFIHQELFKFREFINGMQMFKMFNERTIQKFMENITLHYYLKGEKLYRVGDDADYLYILFNGKVSRKVVIQIEKINKIPSRKFQKQIRILSKSYTHQIQFFKEDIVGVSQIIDKVHYRKQQIDVDEDSILLGIERSIVQQSLDDYIVDRFKKYNLKKYPSNYDQLCVNYQKQKFQMRKSEERKISALQNELKIAQTEKRKQKIESIIRIYQENIKFVDKQNLLSKKLHFQVDLNQ